MKKTWNIIFVFWELTLKWLLLTTLTDEMLPSFIFLMWLANIFSMVSLSSSFNHSTYTSHNLTDVLIQIAMSPQNTTTQQNVAMNIINQRLQALRRIATANMSLHHTHPCSTSRYIIITEIPFGNSGNNLIEVFEFSSYSVCSYEWFIIVFLNC